jgi:ribosome-associated protein
LLKGINKKMILISGSIYIDENEMHFDFIRSSGPGGQNVNKLSTAVQLKYPLKETRNLPEWLKKRFSSLFGKRLSNKGVLIITARRFRSQEKNRQDAINRLVKLLQTAADRPKTHYHTSVPARSKAERIKSKKRVSQKKNRRKPVSEQDI